MKILGVYILLILLLCANSVSVALDLYDRLGPPGQPPVSRSAAPTVAETGNPARAAGPLQTEELRKAGVQESYPILGVDISHWDGAVDWQKLKAAGITFVYIKATEGVTDVDPSFDANWPAADQAGLIRGAYHFFKPGVDPKQQAEYFLSKVDLKKNDLLPMLDVEVNGDLNAAEMTAAIKVWLETVEAKLGRKPVIYTDGGFWNEYITADFSAYPLWVAEWESTYVPKLPDNWKQWVFWQYSSTGTLEGIEGRGDADLDCFNGKFTDLKRWMIR